MTLENTIQAMYDNNPSMFKERSDCLDYLFCTIGNGYEWLNGQLVSYENEDHDQPVNPLWNGKAFQYNLQTLYDDAVQAAHDNDMKLMVPPNPELKNKYHYNDRKERWYFAMNKAQAPAIDPLCKEYAPIWNFPEDIATDWWDGIMECADMLLADGIITKEDTEIIMAKYAKSHKTDNIRMSNATIEFPLLEHIERACAARSMDVAKVLSDASVATETLQRMDMGMHTLETLTHIADTLGCSLDELTGRAPAPNLKRPLGEALTAMGFTPATLRSMATDMISARIDQAIKNIIPNERVLNNTIDKLLYDEIGPIVTSHIRQKLNKAEITVDCKMLFEQDKTDIS